MNTPRPGGGLVPKVLGLIVILFIGILIATYVVARDADPVILDQNGNYRSGGHRSQ